MAIVVSGEMRMLNTLSPQVSGSQMGVDPGDSPRIAMACWDYSWLTRRDGRHCEYRNLEQVFEELALRGYNALRVDPCPHLIAPAQNGLVVERFDVLPEGRALRRGLARPVQVNPRRMLAELLRRAREYDIKLWLSSWFVADTQARRSFVRRPRDFIYVWAETLSFIEREGFAERVQAVDFCHEFPQLPFAAGAHRRIFGGHRANPLPQMLNWPNTAEQKVEEYLLQVPRALRASFPSYRYGVSVSSTLEQRLQHMDTSELDFLDAHIWLNDDPRFRLATGDILPVNPPVLVKGLRGRVAALMYRQAQEHWHHRLYGRLARQADFARVRRLLPVVSEGYVRAPNEQSLDWGWVRAVSEGVVQAALERGISVVSAGIHARPHSAGFWEDVEWHQRLTARIRGGDA